MKSEAAFAVRTAPLSRLTGSPLSRSFGAPGRLFPFILWSVALLLSLATATVAAVAGAQSTSIELLFMLPLASAALLHWEHHRMIEEWEELRRENQALRERQELLRNDLRAAAHDLRGPLVTTRTYLDLLAEGALGPLPAEARLAAAEAARAAERAQAIASSALSSGVRRWETVELDRLFDDVIAALHAEITSSAATIEVTSLPLAAGDRDALYRVFANLIENSLKYAGDRQPRIVISGEREGERCCIAVRDWGIGIPDGQRERVFESGARSTGAAQRAGSGLGLATVAKLVQAHGGDVWIDPVVTDGTCIRVSLPAVA